jgi:Fis family transcriptional regulator
MTRGARPTTNSGNSSSEQDEAPAPAPGSALSDAVARCVQRYLEEIEGELPTDFYQLVLSQVEPPMLEAVLAHTRNNQSKAAYLLGLNRGTLRKKLKQYNLNGK